MMGNNKRRLGSFIVIAMNLMVLMTVSVMADTIEPFSSKTTGDTLIPMESLSHEGDGGTKGVAKPNPSVMGPTARAAWPSNPPRCAGKIANIVAGGRITGTNGDDVIVGSSGDDIIYGGLGNDLICGFDGDDFIGGEAGNDIIYGGDGYDRLSGGGGNDITYGGNGYDTCYYPWEVTHSCELHPVP